VSENKIMKSLLRWLLGETGYSTAHAWWLWALGKPVEKGGKFAAAVGETVVRKKIEEIQEVREALQKLLSTQRQMEGTLVDTQAEIRKLEQEASSILAAKPNEEGKRLASPKVSSILLKKRLLNQYTPKLEGLQAQINSLRDLYQQKQHELEEIKAQQEINRTSAELNEALEGVRKNLLLGKESLDLRNFEQATDAIQNQSYRIQGAQQVSNLLDDPDLPISSLEEDKILESLMPK